MKPSFRFECGSSSTYASSTRLLTVLLGDSKGVWGTETRPLPRYAELDTPLNIC
jgi:hypothetical protein